MYPCIICSRLGEVVESVRPSSLDCHILQGLTERGDVVPASRSREREGKWGPGRGAIPSMDAFTCRTAAACVSDMRRAARISQVISCIHEPLIFLIPCIFAVNDEFRSMPALLLLLRLDGSLDCLPATLLPWLATPPTTSFVCLTRCIYKSLTV